MLQYKEEIEIGDVVMDKNGYRYEVIETGMRCNYKTGVSFAWVKVTPIFHYPKDLYHVNLDMSIDKYLGSYTNEFLIFQNTKEIERKAGFKPDDSKHILFYEDLVYAGRQEFLRDVLKDFIKESLNLNIEGLKEFSNRFRNVNGFPWEDDDDKTAYFIANEIDSHIQGLVKNEKSI